MFLVIPRLSCQKSILAASLDIESEKLRGNFTIFEV